MKKLFLILLGLFAISLVYAAGCCFDPQIGTCSPNSMEGSCGSGYLYNDPTCNSVSECDYGCCTTGIEARYLRQSSCYFLSQASGMQMSWSKMTEAECAKSAGKERSGACIVAGRYDDKTCKFVTKKECGSNEFFPGVLCSDNIIKNQFNISCKKTSDSICYNGDSHFLDSCGNPDVKKDDCDYNSGSICALDKNNKAFCKDLNCVDELGINRKNGESWCYYDGANNPNFQYLSIENISASESNPDGWVEEKVGSRFYRKYCLNGEIQIEPCADFRAEVCDQGKCVYNPWQECLAAGNNTDECDPKWCNVFSGHPGCGLMSTDILGTATSIAMGADGRVPFCKSANGSMIPLTEAEIQKIGKEKNIEGLSAATFPSELRPKIREDGISQVGMNTCVPKIAGGFEFYSTGNQYSTAQTGTTCSAADIQEFEFQFRREAEYPGGPDGTSKDFWMFTSNVSDDNEIRDYGASMVVYSDFRGWYAIDGGRLYCKSSSNISSLLPKNNACLTPWRVPLDEFFKETVRRRCMLTSDCTDNINYVGAGSSAQNIFNDVGGKLSCVNTYGGDRPIYTCKLTFQCLSYQAPRDDSSCEKCNENPDYPCTEYKCKSLGTRCQYVDNLGIDKSYCIKSSDLSEPVISNVVLNPKSPIEPYSSVKISFETNEDALCKFNLGSSMKSIDEMPNLFGGQYEKKHSVILNLPGKIKENVSEDKIQYDFLSRDGKYEMYVRCVDVAGNANLNSHLIKFEVMQTPDGVPPAILNFTPKSGSPIKFNMTEKSIKFKMNEPAECRWDSSDKEFSEMKNEFECDLDIYMGGILNGYGCKGTLTNISAGVGKETRFYIRCKDQPWLEGEETKFYKRNANPTSFVYTLKNSDKLEIVEAVPQGGLTTGPGVTSFNITVRTKGGAENGRAECKWRMIYSNFSSILTKFTITNTALHKQVITNITEGDYQYYIECADIAGNKVNVTKNIFWRVDRESPIISRVYNNKGEFRVITNEASICKFASVLNPAIGCSFSLGGENLTSMSSKSGNLEHGGTWKKGSYYYIKCQDLYGNVASTCSLVGKAI